MFTGIVQAIGLISRVRPQSDLQTPAHAYSDAQGLRLSLGWGSLDWQDVQEGDSISVNGACMTVIAPGPTGFEVDISRESLNRTVGLDGPGPVNLEKALRAQDRLGGHLVSGHVDATAEVLAIDRCDESVGLTVLLPPHLSAFVAEKGSIALQGVSLTINELSDTEAGTAVRVNLIPHTWTKTTLSDLRPGDRLNVEVDQLARQLARLLERMDSLSGRPNA